MSTLVRSLVVDHNLFVMKVIYDGRFIDELSNAPGWVAKQLGLEVSMEVLNAVKGKDNNELISRCIEDYGDKFVELNTKNQTEDMVADVSFRNGRVSFRNDGISFRNLNNEKVSSEEGGFGCNTIEEFMERVIVDGRYITNIDDAQSIANYIGTSVSPSVLKQLKECDPVELLSSTTKKMTRCMGEGIVKAQVNVPVPVATIGGILIVAVGVTFVISAIAVFTCEAPDPSAPECVDLSEDADMKF